MIDLNHIPVVVFRSKEAVEDHAFQARALIPIPVYYYHGKGGGWGNYDVKDSPPCGTGSTPEEAIKNLRLVVYNALRTLPEVEFTDIDISDFVAHSVHSE